MVKKIYFLIVVFLLAFVLILENYQHFFTIFANNNLKNPNINIPFEIQKEDGSSAIQNVDYKVDGITIIFDKSGKYKIVGNGEEVTDTASFKVENNFEGEITLKDVKINLNGRKTAFKVESEAKLTLWLEGDNSLRTGDYTAGIEFMNSQNGHLIIDSKDDSGSLWVVGWHGAAIGGAPTVPWESDDKPRDVSNIEIRGGNIKATSMVRDGTAIGAIGNDSIFSTSTPTVRNLIISGGNITTECNETECVGIGSGKGGRIENLKITGGNIYTEGYGNSAAIGTGDTASIGSIEISGGNITAIAHGDGAAIGSGTDGNVESILITGGNIKATSEGISTAIGVGPKRYDKYPVTINTLKIEGGTIDAITSSSINGIGAIEDKQISKLEINGSSLKTSKIPTITQNSEGKKLSLLTLENMNNISSITINGNDMKINGNYDDDNNFYFYLPQESQEVIIKKNDQSEITKNFIWTGSNFEEENFKQQNIWEQKPSIDGWTYNEQIKQPKGKAKYGNIEFTYSDNKDGPYADLPSEVHAGIWYMKAEVKENSSYTGLSEIVTFEVKKALPEQIQEPTNLVGKEGNKLSTVTLSSGWQWNDENEIMTLGQASYKAKYKVDDRNYDYSNVSGYDGNGYVLRNLKIEITKDKQQNDWKEELNIEGWTYGEQANMPTASSKFGNVIFTYSDKKEGIYSDVVPTNAGTWYVKASVLESESYTGLEAIKEFSIAKANSNIFISTENMNKKYDGKQVDIPEVTKEGSSNEISILWYKNIDGTWNKLNDVPVTVGEYKFVACVKEDNNYNGKVVVKDFKIIKAVPSYNLPNDLIIKQGMELSSIDLPLGFFWVDSSQIANELGKYYFKAIYVPEDKLNYETIVVDIQVEVVEKSEGDNHIPTISAKDLIIKINDKFDPLKNVTATDKEDGDITKNIKVIKNTVDVTKPGIYKVTYEIVDKDGQRVTKTISVTVEEKDENTVIDNNNSDNKLDNDKNSIISIFFVIIILVILIVSSIVLFYIKKQNKSSNIN